MHAKFTPSKQVDHWHSSINHCPTTTRSSSCTNQLTVNALHCCSPVMNTIVPLTVLRLQRLQFPKKQLADSRQSAYTWHISARQFEQEQ